MIMPFFHQFTFAYKTFVVFSTMRTRTMINFFAFTNQMFVLFFSTTAFLFNHLTFADDFYFFFFMTIMKKTSAFFTHLSHLASAP
ncbi:hypothetical protein [Bacillus sp. N1-1]|uniref:hypothetical protein n=1 Tax=Bacillus sp. N1-1 TaxID=2682541 RepID=UPI001316D5FE|nr:hypothetical protein [Bacillus sp. N1-1]QHA91594.1 hypothetical protein GNK04_09240 [Bacillus sp. N1-1]